MSFRGGCGLTEVQYVHTDREITLSRDHMNSQQSVSTSLVFYREDNKPTSAGYGEHRYATAITSLEAVLAIKGNGIQG